MSKWMSNDAQHSTQSSPMFFADLQWHAVVHTALGYGALDNEPEESIWDEMV